MKKLENDLNNCFIEYEKNISVLIKPGIKHIICAWPFDPTSGGRTILFELFTLQTNKDNVYFYINYNYHPKTIIADIDKKFLPTHYFNQQNKYPTLNIATPSMLLDKNNIFYYPEDYRINHLNPLNAKKIVNLVFYFNTINLGNLDKQYHVFYHELFRKHFIKYNSHYNNLPEQSCYKNEIHYLSNLKNILKYCKDFKKERSGSCLIKRKICSPPMYHTEDIMKWHPKNCKEINHKVCASLPQLVQIFNSYECVYSYDVYTFLLKIALLCGCRVFVIPYNNTSRNEHYIDNKDFIEGSIFDYPTCKNYREIKKEYLTNLEEKQKILRDYLLKLNEKDYGKLVEDILNSAEIFFQDQEN